MPGRPSFLQVLEAVHEAWQERRDAVEQNARSLAQTMGHAQLSAAVNLNETPGLLDPELLPAAVRSLGRSEDPDDGGFGAAPKFPPSAVLEFLMRHAAVPSDTAGEARDMAGRTLAAMARSALFDQLDGGFARYSVTRDWSVPHFEKMLYDNAQLLRAYVHWVRLGGTPGFPAAEAADVAVRTAEWMLASLGLPAGSWGAAGPHGAAEALASSLDADSVVNGEHHEGASYLWTAGELEKLLGNDDGAAVARLMNVGDHGTVSNARIAAAPRQGAEPRGGRALGRRPATPPGGARSAGRSRHATTRWWRAGTGWPWRPWPRRARCWTVPGWWTRPSASQATSRGSTGGRREEELVRVSHAGAARGIGGLLEDYAFCGEGFLALFAVTGNAHWYGLAEAVISAAVPAVHCGRQPGGHRRGIRPGVQRPGRPAAASIPSTAPRPAVRRPSPASC